MRVVLLHFMLNQIAGQVLKLNRVLVDGLIAFVEKVDELLDEIIPLLNDCVLHGNLHYLDELLEIDFTAGIQVEIL